MAQPRADRVPALESLRGLAALIVLLSHCFLIWPERLHANVPLWITLSPLRLFSSSYAAVIMFFVLSGYVLTIPFLRHEKFFYPTYLIRRVCRIYLPFVCAIMLAALLYFFCPMGGGDGSNWFYNEWNKESLSQNVVLRHLMMSGVDNDMWLDGVMWSLVHELRLSILFPLLVMLGTKFRRAFCVAVLLYAAATTASIMTGNGWSLRAADDFGGTLLLTLRFAAFFILGTSLAQKNDVIKNGLQRLPSWLWLGLLVIAVAVFTLPPEIHNERLKQFLPIFRQDGEAKYVVEFMLGIASAFILVSARNRESFARVLTVAPVLWLGKVSYSLYLIHLPIALFLFHALLGQMPFGVITCIVVAVSLASAEIFYRLVEQPSIWLGRRLVRRN